jgi:hypothetical protein
MSLKVYNLLGLEVATLYESVRQVESYETTFNGSKLASGNYFYRLNAHNFIETKNLVVLR